MSYLVSALPDDELLLNCTDTVTSVFAEHQVHHPDPQGRHTPAPGHRPDGELDRQADYSCPTLMVADLKEAIEEGEPRAEFVQATLRLTRTTRRI